VLSRAHDDAETEAAVFFESPAALYLASGYAVGFASMAVMKQAFQLIFYDEFAHYALREASAASGLPCHEFKHADPENLAMLLKQRVQKGERPLIATDGIFATIGEVAPIIDLARVIDPYGGHIFVDESHSYGVLGAHGRGVREHWGLSAMQVTSGGSVGKAFGCSGGIIPGTAQSVARLRTTPIAMGASSGSPVNAALCARAFAYARGHPDLLQRLRGNITHAKAGLRRLGLEVGSDAVPIATFGFGSSDSMRLLQQRLMSEGIYVLYTRYIGAADSGVIRCGIFADHTREHIEHLLAVLQRFL
jgi:7-keto-8-aminopelargonate synthetase-like enzyme